MNLSNVSKPRYAVAQEENSVTITIESRRNVFHILFYGLCIIWWFFFLVGLGIFWGYLFLFLLFSEGKGTQTFQLFLVITFLCVFVMQIFHLFYGFGAAYSLLRELRGKEIIEINKPKFIITMQILDWMRPRTYGIEEIGNMRSLKKIGPFFLAPPWRRRYNETIAFDCNGKTFRFGVGLKQSEVDEILTIIQKTLAVI